MSEEKKNNLEELSVQDHLDQIQGRTEKRRKVLLADATPQDHYDHLRDLVEIVTDPADLEDQEDGNADSDSTDQEQTTEEPDKAPPDVWSVEQHLHEIQNRKRGK